MYKGSTRLDEKSIKALEDNVYKWENGVQKSIAKLLLIELENERARCEHYYAAQLPQELQTQS